MLGLLSRKIGKQYRLLWWCKFNSNKINNNHRFRALYTIQCLWIYILNSSARQEWKSGWEWHSRGYRHGVMFTRGWLSYWFLTRKFVNRKHELPTWSEIKELKLKTWFVCILQKIKQKIEVQLSSQVNNPNKTSYFAHASKMSFV